MVIKVTKENIFKNHVLTEVSQDDWLWKNPDSLTYWMEFIVRGSRVIIIGDFGDWVFTKTPTTAKNLLLTASNKEYFWEKTTTGQKEYDCELTRKNLLHEIAEYHRYNKEEFKEQFEDKTLKDLKEEIKNTLLLDTEVNATVFIESTFEFLNPPQNSMVFVYPEMFNNMWKGLLAFREKYWSIYAPEQLQEKPLSEKKTLKKRSLVEWVPLKIDFTKGDSEKC